MATRDALRGRGVGGAHLGAARELAGMVTAALRPPTAQRRAGALQLQPATGDRGREAFQAPVVLVPGYGGNRTNWEALERALWRAGFANLHATAYNPLTTDVPGIAASLAQTCRDAMASAGTSRVHLIGHSLGGVVVRYAVTRLGLSANAATAVTIAAPHRGTAVARLGRGPAAAGLRPGSPLLAELSDPPKDRVRWLAYYSNLDVVAPPRSARLELPALAARNILVPDEGHLSILRSARLVSSIAVELAGVELAGVEPSTVATSGTPALRWAS